MGRQIKSSAWLGLPVLLALALSACDSSGDDEGPGADTGVYDGTWEQIGCASAETCQDVECAGDWQKWRRRIEFVDGSETVRLWLGPDEGKPGYLKGSKICTPFGDAPSDQDMCWPLEWCGDFLLYCLVPELCEKLSQVD